MALFGPNVGSYVPLGTEDFDISSWTANSCRDFLKLVSVQAAVSSILSYVNI
jgi:hypothetical protein